MIVTMVTMVVTMVTMVTMVVVTMACPMMTWRPEVIIGVVGHPGSTGDAEEEGESDPDLFKNSHFPISNNSGNFTDCKRDAF